MSNNKEKKELLKDIITKLHEGARPNEMKDKFKQIFTDVSPVEISRIEEELIKDGMPREKIHKLCDIHLSAFRESLEKETITTPIGHPIHILMEEHKILLKFADERRRIAQKITKAEGFSSASEGIQQLLRIDDQLKTDETHYLREENVLFPYLEKHGVTEPPAILWMDHDMIRNVKKSLHNLIDQRKSVDFTHFVKQLEEVSTSLFELISTHFYKENKILFPTALNVISEGEWKDIKDQFKEIGYCKFTPEVEQEHGEEVIQVSSEKDLANMVTFETGNLSPEEIEAVFNSLPVDVTFIGKDDTVRYFSQSKDRIFVRAKAVIGRKVQNCHPQKSLNVVNQILDDFKNGRREVAKFWITLNGKLVYIRYFPVHNSEGDYLGTLEVTQDITDIKKIEGEKRLLDSQ